MILNNLVIHGIDEPITIQLNTKGYIDAIEPGNNTVSGQSLIFDEAIAFPGLINSHDHLDFNSFPLLGNKTYRNYVEWGEDIHRTDHKVIEEVLRIPKELRVQWSLYKNLLNGVTTVVQHGERFEVSNELIDVFQDCISIHSVQLEKRWRLRLNKPRLKNQPVVIHIGEGTDQRARNEINELIRWNLLKRDIIGIHGIAMDATQAKSFKALIWCPDSNYFLFQKTADLRALKATTSILFGTDSTLTSSWDIWKQIRIGMDTGLATGDQLYKMLTTTPAAVWDMDKKGALAAGKLADIVIAKKKKNEFIDSFLATTPEDILLALHSGEIRLFDQSLHQQLALSTQQIGRFSRVNIGNSIKYLYGNLPEVINKIRTWYPDFKHAGIECII